MKVTTLRMCLACLCLAAVTLLLLAGRIMAAPAELAPGAGVFKMEDGSGANAEPLAVYYYRPAAWTPEQEVVIVLHGVQRNAKEYRNEWIKDAERYNMLVICPQFSERKYPGTAFYNLGHVLDRDDEEGSLQPAEKWVFGVIDRVYNEVEIRTGANKGFTLFGHSAGAQFAHRYLLFAKETKAKRIIAANAGWYTMPDSSVPFPYGLKHSPLTKEQLACAFARPVTILLGEADTKTGGVLRSTLYADRQGNNRLIRGQKFYAMAAEKARTLGTAFNWKLITVPGVGHSDGGMGAAAARLIADGEI